MNTLIEVEQALHTRRLEAESKIERQKLRDEFAMAALPAILTIERTASYAKCAEWAYELSDAMLAERDRKE